MLKKDFTSGALIGRRARVYTRSGIRDLTIQQIEGDEIKLASECYSYVHRDHWRNVYLLRPKTRRIFYIEREALERNDGGFTVHRSLGLSWERSNYIKVKLIKVKGE